MDKMIYFISDTHFFDKRMVHNQIFARRDFLTVNQMNEAIINSWNNVVTANDIVYHLGDIALIGNNRHSHEKLLELLKRLNGKIVFLKGNHDTRATFKYLQKNNILLEDKIEKFVFEDVGILIKHNKIQYYLTHYPLIVGPAPNRINLHGHIHNSSVNMAENINVGVDSADLDYLMEPLNFGTPLSIEMVLKIISAKKIDFQKRR
ncbi:phosphoesterase [Ligilactobacillus hayakitensis DSM 18933 = JCM 14209]|uniref:Phosphoesterase n=2 Tax=Ligilactobacillus TaxID=2767887 RepID=A0A0R1WW24_9LACO|nr:phosphoesterase [Ligilactobacillus hayakitensis DSM 18933 = JCM 14209]